jgi:tetratricopeptide (TPR) repeat protein
LSAVLALVACAYIRAASFEFVYDDLGQIVDNPKIKSWRLALTFFSTHVWSQTTRVAFYYRPVYMLWLRLNYALFGLQPVYWHLAAIAVHLLAGLLLYFLVRRLGEDAWVGIVAVLLFGLHPAHIESVAWISGTTESLMACLLLGSMLLYWRHRDSAATKPTRVAPASLVLALLAVLAKETAIVIPALIFSSEWILYQRDKSPKRRFVSSFAAATPYLLISFGFILARTLVLGSVSPPATTLGRLSVLLAWPADLLFYGSHDALPVHLSGFYRRLAVAHIGVGNFVFPALIVLVGAVGLFWGSRRSRVFAFLAAWWAILMLPVLNVTLFNNAENLHDRYLYLPSAAVCVALAMLLAALKSRYRKTGIAALIAIAAAYAGSLTAELPYWRNDFVLAKRGMEVSPGQPIAPQVMGNALLRNGNIEAAIPYLVDSLDSMPSNVETLYSLAYSYCELNALDLAEHCIDKAIALVPSEPRAHLLLGRIRLKQKRLDEAETECRRAIALQPISNGVAGDHYYLGDVLYAKGHLEDALREYRLEPENGPATDPAFEAAQRRIREIEGRRASEGR